MLDALGRGERDKEIARRLSISIHTVRAHVRNLMRELGATTRAEAVARSRHRARH